MRTKRKWSLWRHCSQAAHPTLMFTSSTTCLQIGWVSGIQWLSLYCTSKTWWNIFLHIFFIYILLSNILLYILLFYIDTFVTDSFYNFVDFMFWIESKCESLKSMHDINKCQSSIQWLLENCFTLRYYASVMGCMKLLLRFFFFFLKGAVIFQTPLPFKINK